MKCLVFGVLLLLFSSISFCQNSAVCGFTNKKVITIQGSQISGGPHTDFPILIDHTDGVNLTTAAGKVTSASGFDIVFADDNGNLLDFQLEDYNGTTGQVVTWVKIPTLTNGTDLNIHMLYGKASILTDQSSTSTWKNSYEAVYHLNDDFNDKTSNTNNGTNVGSTDIASKIADGQDFESTNSEYVQISDLAAIEGLSQVTMSCWVTPESFSTYDGILTKYTAFSTYYGINCTSTSEGGLDGLTCGVGNSSYGYTATGQLSVGTTTHIAMVFDGTQTGNANRLKLYLDGVNVGLTFFGTTPAVTASSTAVLEIGRVFNANGQAWDGIIDQVAIESTAQSANWVSTQYSAQNSPEGTFYTIGSELDNVYSTTNNGDWDQDNRWSGSGIPHVGANVIINHAIDIDINSDDYVICSCTISNTGGISSNLDLDDARVLTIIEDLTIVNTNDSEIDLTVDDNGTSVFVLGDMLVTNNSVIGREIQVELNNASIFSVTGDVIMNNTTGNFIEIQTMGTTDFDIGGDLVMNHDGGNNMLLYIDENSTMDITGDLTVDQDGGNDIAIWINDNINGSANLTIGGDFEIEHDGGDDLELRVDDAGSVLQVNGNFNVDVDAADDDDIIFNLDGGNFNVVGTTTLTRRNDFHEISFDMDNGDFTSGLLTTNNLGTDAADHSIWLSVDATSIFTINGDVNINQSGGNNTHLRANNNAGTSAQIIISGNVNIDHDGGSNIQLSSSGDNSIFDINGNVNIDQDGGAVTQLQSLGANSLLDISGTLIVDHDGGDMVELQTDGTNALLNIGGATTVNWNDGLNSEFEVDANDGEVFFTGAFSATRLLSTGRIELDLDGGDITFNTGSTISSEGALFTDGAINIRIDVGSVLTNTGDMSMLMTGGDDLNLFIDVDGAGTNSQFLCTGDLLISRINGDDININIDNANSLMDIDGDFTIVSTGGEVFDLTIDDDATLNVDGSLIYFYLGGQDGVIELENGGAPSLDIGNDFIATIAGGSADLTFDLNAGEVQVGRDMTISETTGANLLFINADGADLSVTRDFLGAISGGNNTGEILVDLDNGSVMSVGNDFTLMLSGGNDIELEIEQNVTTGTSQLNVIGDMTLDHNGSTGGDDIQFELFDDAIVSVVGDFTMDTDGSGSTGNFYTRMNNSSLLDVDGDIYMTSPAAGFLEVTLNNSSKIEIEGDFIRQAIPNNFGFLDANGTSTIEYNGSAVQVIAEDAGAGTDGFEYQNVIINNSFGTAPQLTMEGLATVNGDITFTDGIISSTATDLLVIEDNSDALTESDASFVDGPVKKIGDDQFDFPIGDDGQLQQLSITAPGLATDEFTAQYLEVDPHPTFNEANKDASIDHISSCEYWTLDRAVGSSNVQVTLNYDANSCGVTDLSSLIVARWDGTTWRDHGGTVAGTVTNGTVQTPAVVSSAYIANMPFTLASLNGNNPLPIDLVSFDAISNQDNVALKWTTKSEINNDYFTVERSSDAQNWETILTKDGAGNSSNTIHYSDVDNRPLSGTSYYRLKQTDFDGLFKYSEAILVSRNASNKFVIYPNPNTGNESLNILLPDDAVGQELLITIDDMLGQVIFSKSIQNTESSNLIQVAPSFSVLSGTYVLSIFYNNRIFYQKMVVE